VGQVQAFKLFTATALRRALVAACLAVLCAGPAAAKDGRIKVKVPAGSGLNIVNDYGVPSGTFGRTADSGRNASHHGIDFSAEPGTMVISASHGEIAWMQPNACSGYDIAVKTSILAPRVPGRAPEPIYAVYSHAKALPNLAVGDQVKPGDELGEVLRLLGTPCYASKPHVHFELRFNNKRSQPANPHRFWALGPGRVTCFRPDEDVPADRIVAPLACN